MNSNEVEKEKENNKTAIFEKLMESMISEEVVSEGLEDLSRNVEVLMMLPSWSEK